MKRLFVLSSFLTVMISVFAQEAANSKIQAGLSLSSGLNFISPNTKVIESNGVGSNLGVGMALNYSFTPTIGFSTGLIFDFETLKYIASSSDSLFYLYNDAKISAKKDYMSDGGTLGETDATLYRVTNRTQKPLYLTIPTMLLFRTKFIGYFRYFGKFGVKNSFLLTNKINDQGAKLASIDPSSTALSFENNNMQNTKRNLSLYKGFVGISGGVEWNFTGTTSLVAELGYYYGFVNINRGDAIGNDEDKNKTIFSKFDNGSPSNFQSLDTKQNQLVLKVSILF
jgi:hypothetical protein